MTKQSFLEYCLDTYGTSADYPFEEDFETGVFRHTDSGKWFGIAMTVGREKLGCGGDGQVDIVNFKCAPEVIESLVGAEQGVYRAYHMNKVHWLTVVLSECDGDTVAWLLGISHTLTAPKTKQK